MAAIGAIIGAASSAIGGIFQGIGARKAARRAARRARQYQRQLDAKVADRQDIIDPSDLMQDRSNLIQNQFGNLQVATQAAEFQAEQAVRYIKSYRCRCRWCNSFSTSRFAK